MSDDTASTVANWRTLAKINKRISKMFSKIRKKLEINQLNSRVVSLYQKGHYEEGVRYANQSVDLTRQVLGEHNPDFAQSLHNMALLYYSMGDYAAAEPLYKRSLEIRRAVLGEHHPRFATSLNNLGLLYHSMGDYAAAKPLYKQALEIRRAVLGKQHADFAQSLDNLAGLYYSMGDFTAAEPLHKQAIEINRSVLGEHHPRLAQSLSNLGLLYKSMGNYIAAEPLYQQALEIDRMTVGEYHPTYAITLNNIAELHKATGNYLTAESLHLRAIEIRRQTLGDAHPAFLQSMVNLADLYTLIGRYADAERLYHLALDVYRQTTLKSHPDFARTLNNSAVLYERTGDYARAESLHQQALEIRRMSLGEMHPEFAASLNNLAVLFQLTRNYVAAIKLQRQALEIWHHIIGEQHPDFVSGLSNLAVLYELMGDYRSAESLYQQAIEIRRQVLGESHPDFASSLNNLALLYKSIGNYSAAEPLYQQTLAVWRRAKMEGHPRFAGSLNNLASLLAATHRATEARVLMEQSRAIEDCMIGQVFSIGSEKQRTAYLKTIRGGFDSFISLVSQHFLHSPEAARSALSLVLRRKAIESEGLATQRDAVLGGKYPEVAPKLREITTLRTQIAQKTLAGAGKEVLQAHQQLLAEWDAQKERLEAEVARQVPEMNMEQKLRSIDPQIVAMAMPVGATLVELVRFNVYDFKAVLARGEKRWKPGQYFAFVMRAREPDNVEMIDLGEAEPLERMVARFREIITSEAEEGKRGLGAAPKSARCAIDQEVGVRLREAIFAPLLKAIGNSKRLMISPDGDLSRLPFEVLPIDDGRRLIDEYRISYLGAGRDVVRFGFKSNRQSSRSLVAADPDFDLDAKVMRVDVAAGTGRRSRDLKREAMGTFERLPGTRREGENIAAMLEAELWTGGAALDARLKRCQSPRILHLATHGFFLEDQKRDPNDERFGSGAMSFSESGMQRLADARFENPLLRSGLALAGVNTWLEKGELMEEAEDGLLTAEDVSGLDLLDTELVVLSACDTGLGEVHVGEGVFGLQRAFVLAGAKTLVMSLWEVPDEQTRELMEDFYRRILAGEPRADALREAQLAIKAKHPEPFYWGAFICQGYDGPLAAY